MKKGLSLFLVFAVLCSFLMISASAASNIVFTDGVCTISEGGEYQLTSGSKGAILIDTTAAVTIIGPAGTDVTNSETALTAVSIYGVKDGIDLTIQNLFITGGVNYSGIYPDDSTYANIIHVQGAGNKLTLAGVNDLECSSGGAVIHVDPDAELTIGGTGTLYLYKSGAWTCIGGNGGETNGKITIDGGSIFAKGTKQGAVIGSGSNCADTPGDITINGGVLNLIANARGALIGTGSGVEYTSYGDVTINGGSINMNVDFTGAAIGASGSKTEGPNEYNVANGTVTVTGGSLRVFIDKNSYSGWGLDKAGVSPVGITAYAQGNVKNSDGTQLYMCTVPTSSNGNHTIVVDDVNYYTGPIHAYCYCNETAEKEAQSNITSTASNWIAGDDNNLYFYLPAATNTITVDETEYSVAFDDETKTFALTKSGAAGNIEVTVTNSTGGVATVTAPTDGWVEGANTFTVSADKACVVAVATTDEEGNVSYDRLSATANGDGSYSFTTPDTFTASNGIVVVVKGDVNGDYSCDSADAAAAGAYEVGNITSLTALQLLTMDVNKDGAVDSADSAAAKAAEVGNLIMPW